MNRTWKPTVAGILGICGTFVGLMAVLLEFVQGRNAGRISWSLLIVTWLLVILPLVAGVCSLKRRIWWLALIGSIPGMYGLTGIPAFIFVVTSKKEFTETKEATPQIPLPVTAMRKTWKPTVGGILDIISGVLNLYVTWYAMVASSIFWRAQGKVSGTIQIIGIVLVFGVDILGGIYALRREKWPIALVGSITSLFSMAYGLGLIWAIPALIFVAISKDEFVKAKKQTKTVLQG